jgi:hypothetical protein
MQIPPGVSDDCADALVELCFVCTPAMDADELAGFLGAVLRIVEREVSRAVAEERRRASEGLTRWSAN